MSNRGLVNKEESSRGTQGGHGRMGRERQGVFVIERSPRDREGTYMGRRSREVRAR